MKECTVNTDKITMKKKFEPTLRQLRTAKNLVTNGGKMEPAMKEAGFSKAYAESGKLKKTKTWQQLMDEHFPESKIALRIGEGLDADRVVAAMNTGKDATAATADFIEVPDLPTRHRYVETAMKARGKLTEKVDVTSEGEKIGGFVVVKTEPPTTLSADTTE